MFKLFGRGIMIVLLFFLLQALATNYSYYYVHSNLRRSSAKGREGSWIFRHPVWWSGRSRYRLSMAMLRHKSCTVYAFHAISTSYLAENAILVKRIGRTLSMCDVIAMWPDLTQSKFLWCKGWPISYGKFQDDLPSALGTTEQTHGGITPPPLPLPARVKHNKNDDILIIYIWWSTGQCQLVTIFGLYK